MNLVGSGLNSAQGTAKMKNATPSQKHCSACNATFETDGLRRVHAKSQWHVENMKRRVAGLPPIDASAVPTKTERPRKTRASDVEGSESSSSESDEEPATAKLPEFAPGQCLFCQEISPSFDANIVHMEQSHGLYVPDKARLVVDLETLIRYFHLVIFGYRECLYCHSQRRTVQAAQQHMAGKGHCRIDIENPESEYRDFFDMAETQSASYNGTNPGISPDSDRDFARLPSGRIISSRASKPAPTHRLTHQTGNETTPEGLPVGPSESKEDASSTASTSGISAKALVKKGNREDSLATQLSSLRVGDRASLAHMSSSQQLAVLSTQRKQLAKARRAERRYRSRVEMTGNRTLMGNFVSDIYGGLPVQMYG